MVLLIDANILLDVLMNRQEFVTDSSMIWKLCETEQAKGYISVLTYANIMYIMRKQLTPEKIEEVFEDAVQSATAEAIHADYIVTRNIKDFVKSKVVAFTPGELLARL